MKDNKVLIDTSVWIDYFKGKNIQLAEKVDEALTFYEVFVPKIVVAELIQGSKSEKEIKVFEEFLGAFKIIDHTENTWIEAGRLSFSMKRKGLMVNLIDCYIAVLSMEYSCKIFSLDQHFRNIKKFSRLEMFI